MSKNSGKDKDKIPKKDRVRARRAARALCGGVPEPNAQEESEIPNPLIENESAGNQLLVEPDENDDPLARPSTADVVMPPTSKRRNKKSEGEGAPSDDDIPAGRSAKPKPMKPIKLPNNDWGPHRLRGD